MEGLAHADGEVVSHGACVAVGCVTVLDLYGWLLAQDLAGIDAEAVLAAAPGPEAKRAAVRAAFGPGAVGRPRDAGGAGQARRTGTSTAPVLARLRGAWPGLRDRLRRQVVPPGEMRAMLRAAGAPATAAEIGVDPARLRRTVGRARFLRSRYTILDLLDETGLLDRALDATIPSAVAAS